MSQLLNPDAALAAVGASAVRPAHGYDIDCPQGQGLPDKQTPRRLLKLGSPSSQIRNPRADSFTRRGSTAYDEPCRWSAPPDGSPYQSFWKNWIGRANNPIRGPGTKSLVVAQCIDQCGDPVCNADQTLGQFSGNYSRREARRVSS